MTKKREAVNVGIDVGKAQLDVYLLERDLKLLGRYRLATARSAGRGKVALTACIRKIVTALNAMLRDNVKWQPTAQ